MYTEYKAVQLAVDGFLENFLDFFPCGQHTLSSGTFQFSVHGLTGLSGYNVNTPLYSEYPKGLFAFSVMTYISTYATRQLTGLSMCTQYVGSCVSVRTVHFRSYLVN